MNSELALCRKQGAEINKLLILAQEALFRCLPDSEVFMAFLRADKTPVLQGRLKEKGFNERECVWVDQIVGHITMGFANSKA